MDVLITGVAPGMLNEDVACFVEYADEPVLLHVEAQIKVCSKKKNGFIMGYKCG